MARLETLRRAVDGDGDDAPDALVLAAHSLKGMSGVMGLEELASVAGEIEEAVDRLSAGNPQGAVLLSRRLAAAERLLRGTMGQGSPGRVSLRPLLAAIADAARGFGRARERALQVVIQGQQAEMGRAAGGVVAEALLELVRNAVCHGIEPPRARRASGKAPVAQIRLQVRRERGDLVLEVADDGRGMLSGELEQAFRPGFSTASRTDTMVGTGQGLSGLRRSLERHGLVLSLSSEHGVGTTAQIRIPRSDDGLI